MAKKRSGKSKAAPTPPVVHPNAAGIDIGATEIFVAVPVDRDQSPVRSFHTFTQDLCALADWLQQCGIQTVAMESTGVYWIPLFQILEARGLKVCLVNAHYAKNVPGRRTDVLGMVEALKAQEQDPSARELSFLERFGLLVDQQWNWRENQALSRRLKNAKLRTPNACVEEIDFRTGTDHALIEAAGRDGYAALYTRAQSLFRDLAMARADGSLRSLLARLSRIDVLVIDDWAMAPLSESERRDFWEICEDRYQVRSTILTSQLPVSRWHEQIGDPTLADGILDRLVHNAHRIEMRGDSMRKNRGKAAG